MWPLLLILPVIWVIAYKQGRDSGPRGPMLAPATPPRPTPWNLAPAVRSLPRGLRATAAHYLDHLNEAAAAARALDLVKPAALAADLPALMAAPPEVAHAIAVLSAPIEVLYAQRDLNVLGAEPALPEDGRMGSETAHAIAAFQQRFGQEASGRLDAQTAAAIRYAVGCIYSQDKAFVV
jgi:hypothetical protein